MKGTRPLTNSLDPYEQLANAVILQAVEDFRNAVRRMYRNPRSESASRLFEDARSFFLSEDFSLFSSLSGEMLERRLMAEIPGIFLELDAKEKQKHDREEQLMRAMKNQGGSAA